MGLLPDSWSALYQAQISRYESIVDSDHNMDSKGGVMLGAIFAIAIFALNKQLFMTDNKFIFTLLILGCLIYVITASLLLYALKPKFYSLPANTTKDHPEYLTKQDDDLMYQLVSDVEFAADEVETGLRRKAVVFTASTILFIIGTISLLIVKLIAG